MDLILNYIYPKGEVVTIGKLNKDRWYHSWLNHMVESNPDVIFFYTVATTDIPFEGP